ncbi:MAG: hypothetical protein U0892_12105 [Pirellulales bacterium]
MTELLFESPVTVGVAGGFFTVVALVLWVQAGYRAALFTGVGMAVLTVIGLLLSTFVMTDREQIEQTLYAIADHVEHNRIDEAVNYVDPNTRAMVDRVRGEFRSYKFQEARITGIRNIEVNHKTKPVSAVAEFNVAVSLELAGQPYRGVRRFVRLYFFQKNGKWLVNNYEHFEPTAGFRESTPPPKL